MRLAYLPRDTDLGKHACDKTTPKQVPALLAVSMVCSCYAMCILWKLRWLSQEELDDEDDWNPSKAAGVCLMLLATLCEDDVLPQVSSNVSDRKIKFHSFELHQMRIPCAFSLFCFSFPLYSGFFSCTFPYVSFWRFIFWRDHILNCYRMWGFYEHRGEKNMTFISV